MLVDYRQTMPKMEKALETEDTYFLIQKVCEGSKSAFDVLYSRFWMQVYNAAYKRLENPARAKDVAQDVFMQLWVQLAIKKTTTDIQNFSAFLYILVRNNVFKIWKKEKKYIPISDVLVEFQHQKINSCDGDILYNELFYAFNIALEKLPEQQQKIFRMYYIDDHSSLEIAEILNISPKTVRNQLGRAAKKLRPIFILMLETLIN